MQGRERSTHPRRTTRTRGRHGPRDLARLVLTTVGVAALLIAGWRYVSTRSPEPVEDILSVTPDEGPVGTHPVVELSGWESSARVRLRFCAPGDDHRCSDLGEGAGRDSVRLEAIPASLSAPDGGEPEPVTPGRYDILATSSTRTERIAFEVVPFRIGPPPRARDWTGTDVASLRLTAPREVAEGAGCLPVVVPDGRLLVGRTLFDPATAATYDVAVAASELLWSPNGMRLAIVPVDRKEVRIAEPDGSQAQAVVREPRGLISSVTWSPDSDRIAFVVRADPAVRGGPSRPGVAVFSLLDGSRADAGPGEAVAWAPEGDVLAVETAEGGGRSIYRAELGAERIKLVDGRRPSWSPGGELLTFVRPADGETGEAWVTTGLPGAQQRLIEDPLVCGTAFSADGRSLVVSSKRGDTFALDVRGLRTS